MNDDARALRHVQALFGRSITLKQEIVTHHAEVIVDLAKRVGSAICAGRKVLLCGNGGSAADAQHLAAEMLVRLRPHVNREALPALSLSADMSSLTACANDYGYEGYFERMIRALGVPGDVLIGISTSGKSPSIVRALTAARDRKMTTLGLLGGLGMPASALCDAALIVPSTETGRVQEVHITAGHALLELVEEQWLLQRPS